MIVGFYKMRTSSDRNRWFVRIFDGKGIYKKEIHADRLEKFFKASN